ncbi:MAG: hypothetical protein ACYC7D_05365 [Nitrososphaerales archaeon]
MTTKVSASLKKWLDFLLAIAGFAVGLATNTGLVGPVIGLGAGYLVSDLVAEVDAGAVDPATLTAQIETIATKVVQEKAKPLTSL